MRKSKSMRKSVVIRQSFNENGRNGDAYRYQRRFFPFKNCEKVGICLTYQNVRFPPARSTGISHRQIAKEATSPDRKRGQMARSQKRPDRQIAKEARSPDRKRGQIARSQKKPDRINTTFIAEFGPCQIGRNPPDRQAPDRSRSTKKPDRQIGTARSAPDHFRLASPPPRDRDRRDRCRK